MRGVADHDKFGALAGRGASNGPGDLAAPAPAPESAHIGAHQRPVGDAEPVEHRADPAEGCLRVVGDGLRFVDPAEPGQGAEVGRDTHGGERHDLTAEREGGVPGPAGDGHRGGGVVDGG
jgi:hypothetical protein